jgi:long-chain acyl-CoA synthetase
VKILLTGATGIVGCEVVRALLRPGRDETIVALLRGTPREIDESRRRLLRWSDAAPSDAARLTVVAGDVTLPGLGLAGDARSQVASIDTVLHAAAVTRFDQSRESAMRNNVAGTVNVLDFARQCRGIERIGIVSTAYVAGRRRGTIGEDELDLGEGFNNEYERSKALAECAARKAMAELPIAVYRLSIVTGRGTDGTVSRLAGVYPILRLFHAGLLGMFPGQPEQRLDLIPADFAAGAICHLLTERFTPGATYHVCAGDARSLTLAELFPRLAECLALADPRWQRRGQPLPLAVHDAVFREFLEIVELTGNPRLKEIVRQTQTLTRLLENPKVFDTTRCDAALAGDGPVLPHVGRWLPAIVNRGVATNWQHASRRAPDA